MDTPQIDPARSSRLRGAGAAGTDAVIGRASDGGWWGLGLRRPDRRVFDGVPMSEDHTGAMQVEALRALGLRFAELEPMDDVDTIEDARAVAQGIPAPLRRDARRSAAGRGGGAAGGRDRSGDDA